MGSLPAHGESVMALERARSALKNKKVGRLGGASLLALVALVGAFEGYKEKAYRDSIGVPTICYGYTDGVQMGDRKTKEECDALLVEELEEANAYVDGCITVPLTANQRTALVSLTYNTGPKAVCGSTLQRRFNARQYELGCKEILKWKYAGGKVLPGLERRRREESELCLTP